MSNFLTCLIFLSSFLASSLLAFAIQISSNLSDFSCARSAFPNSFGLVAFHFLKLEAQNFPLALNNNLDCNHWAIFTFTIRTDFFGFPLKSHIV
jgi:hypothetical protein